MLYSLFFLSAKACEAARCSDQLNVREACHIGNGSKVVVTSNSLANRSSFSESPFVVTQSNYRKLQRAVKRK